MEIFFKNKPIYAYFFFLLVLYIAALNPYLAPETYDNIVYFIGARSFASSGAYLFYDQYIVDWPPMFSFLLSIPMHFGLDSVWVAKIFVLGFVAIGLFFTYRILIIEKKPFPLLSTLIFGLLPCSFIWGSRVMTEWPFIATSFAYLYYLNRLKVKNCFSLSAFTGLLLGISLLIRHVGIVLLIPLIVQAYNKRKQAKSLKFELLALITGITLFIIFWVIPRSILVIKGLADSGYYQLHSFPVISHWYAFISQSFYYLHNLEDLFFNESFLKIIFNENHIPILGLIILFLIIIGIKNHLKYLMSISDWYVISTIVLLSVFSSYKFTRYFLPIAPFLISYFLEGLFRLSFSKKTIFNSLIAFWIIFLVAFDFHLLLFGNRKSYNGLNYLVSPTEKHFYLGYWRDLYDIGQFVKQLKSTTKVVNKNIPHEKYVKYFSDKNITYFSENNFDYILIEKNNNINKPFSGTIVKENNSFIVLKSTNPEH